MWVPLVNVQGVYILPGIPRLFQQMVAAHKSRFQGPAASTTELLTNWGEGDLAGERLHACTREHGMSVWAQREKCIELLACSCRSLDQDSSDTYSSNYWLVPKNG